MSYDDSYRETEALFGDDPEAILVRQVDALDRGRPVLDVGCGQGRNALFLARRGLSVLGLEPSRVGGETLQSVARAEGLDLSVRFESFEGFGLERRGAFGAVLVFGLIQILPWRSIEGLLRRLEVWTAPSGLTFITAFTTDDEGFAMRAAEPERFRPIGSNSTTDGEGEIRTYLVPGQLAELFAPSTWEMVHLWEGLGPEHCHGDSPPERHGLVEGVFRRR